MSHSIVLTGDSMVVRRNPIPDTNATRRLRQLLAQADIVFTNLEVMPINNRGYPRGNIRGTYLIGPSGVVDDLRDLGISLFSCANNHTLNFGTEGVGALVDVMNAKGVSYSGVGLNLAEARMPTYYDGPSGSAALISCTSTFRPGEQAGPQRSDFVGRPGVNPLTLSTTYEVTSQQFHAVRELAEALGIERSRKLAVERGMRHDDSTPGVLTFLENTFKESAETRTVTTYLEKDVEGLVRSVREARRRADTVIVSIHSHESGKEESEPPDFLIEFGKRMIDEGADIVVGHGPHTLRGMEVYRGRPIFYSLGNFIAQNDYVVRQPAEAYEYAGADPDDTPADLAEKRSEGGRRGFVAHCRYWESVMPYCTFRDGRLHEIEIYPLSLGFGRPAPHRGRPVVVEGADADRILTTFGDLSKRFGAELNIDAGVGRIRV